MKKQMSGTIEELPSGRFRLRLRIGGRYQSAGTYETHKEAQATLTALQGNYRPPSGQSVAIIGEEVLDYREKVRKVRSIDNERLIWKNHVASATWYRQPIEKVTRRDVRVHFEAKLAAGDSMHVVGPALRLLRAAFREAVDREIISVNPIPARDFKIQAPVSKEAARSADEEWTFLDQREQVALLGCEAIPLDRRIVYAVALYTGARLSELKAVQWQDLSLDDEVPSWRLCRGQHGPTKNGRVRDFPLLMLDPTPGIPADLSNAVTALRYWRSISKLGTKPTDLVFPGRGGSQRHAKNSFGWRDRPRGKGAERVLKLGSKSLALGVDRKAGFHCLRHSCASALISGLWGRVWTKAEIQAWMGWRSPSMVERYAHLSGANLRKAALETTKSSHEVPTNTKPPKPVDTKSAYDSEGLSGWAIAGLNCGLPPCEEGTLPLS